jgi:hypothetical protein
MARKDPRERLLARGVSQGEICTRHCGARCCRYVTVGISAPRSHADWDEVRWWVAHEGVSVTREDDGAWMVVVRTPCRNLRPDGACGIYGEHMDVCREHAVEDCEFAVPVPFDLELRSEADLADYLERRRLRRGRRVAESIRRAAATRPRSRSPLVQVLPLAPGS